METVVAIVAASKNNQHLLGLFILFTNCSLTIATMSGVCFIQRIWKVLIRICICRRWYRTIGVFHILSHKIERIAQFCLTKSENHFGNSLQSFPLRILSFKALIVWDYWNRLPLESMFIDVFDLELCSPKVKSLVCTLVWSLVAANNAGQPTKTNRIVHVLWRTLNDKRCTMWVKTIAQIHDKVTSLCCCCNSWTCSTST